MLSRLKIYFILFLDRLDVVRSTCNLSSGNKEQRTVGGLLTSPWREAELIYLSTQYECQLATTVHMDVQ